VAACGIVVNVIAPGAVDTDMASALLQSRRQAMLRVALHGRAATPEEIAGTALYLASEDSGHLTGQVISPNGGLYM
jgi:NAD(P)-dependent dehydrogenase (short-subunit alcohol dehydrogenase family)